MAKRIALEMIRAQNGEWGMFEVERFPDTHTFQDTKPGNLLKTGSAEIIGNEVHRLLSEKEKDGE